MRKGYTIIEVSLVLAVSGLLLVGMIGGLSVSIAQQRYNDTVQDFAEYLRAVYGRVENPQGADAEGGDGEEAYYGRMILLGAPEGSPDESMMCDYAVYAKADLETKDGDDTLSALKSGDSGVTYAADTQVCHTLLWDAEVQNTAGDIFAGVVMILRSPMDDAVHTYVSTDGWSVTSGGKVSLSGGILSFYPDGDATGNSGLVSGLLNGVVQMRTVDFCIDSDDLSAVGGIRRDIRLAADGNNATAVELVNVNSDDNACDR